MNLAANRDFSDTEDVRNLRSGQAFNVPQHDAGSLARGETLEPGKDQLFSFFQRQLPFGVGCRRSRFGDTPDTGKSGAPVTVVADVYRNAVKPGFRIRADTAMVAEHPEEDFLGGVLCILRIAQQAICGAPDHLLVGGEQLVRIVLPFAAQHNRQW